MGYISTKTNADTLTDSVVSNLSTACCAARSAFLSLVCSLASTAPASSAMISTRGFAPPPIDRLPHRPALRLALLCASGPKNAQFRGREGVPGSLCGVTRGRSGRGMGMRWRVPGMKVLGFGRDSSEAGKRSDIDMDMENSPAPSRTSPVVGVLMGSGRESYGDPALDRNFPRTYLRPECSYSCSLCLLLAEANVPFEMYKTDLGGKASWHAQVNPKMETPSLRLAHQEEWIHGTDKIVDMLASDVREVAALSTCTPPGCPAEGAAAREHLDPQMCSFALFMALAGPSKMRDFLLSKHGLDPKEEDVRGVVLALRKRQRQVLERWEEALASRDYLCGSRPGLLDAR